MDSFIQRMNTDLVLSELHNFTAHLSNLSELLASSNHQGQANVISKLLFLLEQKDIGSFVKLMNSVDMWGGSGAVWEVYIENVQTRKLFYTEMIRLIEIAKKTKILIYSERIYSTQRFLIEELSKDQTTQ